MSLPLNHSYILANREKAHSTIQGNVSSVNNTCGCEAFIKASPMLEVTGCSGWFPQVCPVILSSRNKQKYYAVFTLAVKKRLSVASYIAAQSQFQVLLKPHRMRGKGVGLRSTCDSLFLCHLQNRELVGREKGSGNGKSKTNDQNSSASLEHCKNFKPAQIVLQLCQALVCSFMPLASVVRYIVGILCCC